MENKIIIPIILVSLLSSMLLSIDFIVKPAYAQTLTYINNIDGSIQFDNFGDLIAVIGTQFYVIDPETNTVVFSDATISGGSIACDSTYCYIQSNTLIRKYDMSAQIVVDTYDYGVTHLGAGIDIGTFGGVQVIYSSAAAGTTCDVAVGNGAIITVRTSDMVCTTRKEIIGGGVALYGLQTDGTDRVMFTVDNSPTFRVIDYNDNTTLECFDTAITAGNQGELIYDSTTQRVYARNGNTVNEYDVSDVACPNGANTDEVALRAFSYGASSNGYAIDHSGSVFYVTGSTTVTGYNYTGTATNIVVTYTLGSSAASNGNNLLFDSDNAKIFAGQPTTDRIAVIEITGGQAAEACIDINFDGVADVCYTDVNNDGIPDATPFEVARAGQNITSIAQNLCEQVGICPEGSDIRTNGGGYLVVVIMLGIMIVMFYLGSGGELGKIPTFVWVVGALSVLGAAVGIGFTDVVFFIIGILVIIALASAKILSALERF